MASCAYSGRVGAAQVRRWFDHRRRNTVDDCRIRILHIETPPAELVESGGVFHGIQLWVNLPRKDKFATPRYQAIEGDVVSCCRRRTVARWSGLSQATSTVITARVPRTLRSPWRTPRLSPVRV